MTLIADFRLPASWGIRLNATKLAHLTPLLLQAEETKLTYCLPCPAPSPKLGFYQVCSPHSRTLPVVVISPLPPCPECPDCRTFLLLLRISSSTTAHHSCRPSLLMPTTGLQCQCELKCLSRCLRQPAIMTSWRLAPVPMQKRLFELFLIIPLLFSLSFQINFIGAYDFVSFACSYRFFSVQLCMYTSFVLLLFNFLSSSYLTGS